MNQLFELVQHFAEILEPVGIIGGLVFSGAALRNDIRSRKIENHIKLAEGHRAIWSAVLSDPSLDRVRSPDVDLELFPVTPAEDRLVRFIFLNLLLAFEADQNGQLGNIGDVKADASKFLSRPIPRAVWREIEQFQPDGFKKFIHTML